MARRANRTYRAIPSFYDDEYADLDTLQHDVGFYLSKLPKRSQRVLSLACGTARDALPIAQAGHRVVGVDVDADMLNIAKQKRDSIGLTDDSLRLVRQNLLNLSLPGQRFDHACMLFNTFIVFTALAEQDRVLQRIHRHLKPGGTLCIDVFNPDSARVNEEREEDVAPMVFFSHELGRTVQRVVTLWRDPTRPQVRHTRFDYAWHDDDGTPRRKRVEFENTWFYPRELQLLLERNGLEWINAYGDHAGGPVTPDAPRVMAWAKRRR
ncbi:MAG: class I SAM-dependent methyltransferase [Tepidisphaeraceae bacterium]